MKTKILEKSKKSSLSKMNAVTHHFFHMLCFFMLFCVFSGHQAHAQDKQYESRGLGAVSTVNFKNGERAYNLANGVFVQHGFKTVARERECTYSDPAFWSMGFLPCYTFDRVVDTNNFEIMGGGSFLRYMIIGDGSSGIFTWRVIGLKSDRSVWAADLDDLNGKPVVWTQVVERLPSNIEGLNNNDGWTQLSAKTVRNPERWVYIVGTSSQKEVLVTDPWLPKINMQYMPVYQSTTLYNEGPERAKDGIISDTSHTHTNHSVDDPAPWWRVDSMLPLEVAKVRIWPRTSFLQRWNQQQWDVELLGRTGEILQSKRIPAITSLQPFDIDFDIAYQYRRKVYSVRVQYKRDGRLGNFDDDYLSISELQIFGVRAIATTQDNTMFGYDTNRTYGKNLALFKTASQSGLWERNTTSAAHAVDGWQNHEAATWDGESSSKITIVPPGSGAGGWWEVDLGVPSFVNKVRVYNRSDSNSYYDRYKNINIKLLDQNGAVLAAQYEVNFQDTKRLRKMFDYYFSGVSGVRKVRIEQRDQEFLNFGEVEVYGVEQNATEPNLARVSGAYAVQGSNWDSITLAVKAIDGDKSGYNHNTLAHTSNNGSYWGSVLPAPRTINLIRLWRRQDCCYDQNNTEIKLQLYNTNGNLLHETGLFRPNSQRQFDVWIPNVANVSNVKVTSGQNLALTLAEVEVFGSSYPGYTVYIGKNNNTYATPAVFTGGAYGGFTQTLAESPLFLQNHIGQVESFTLNNARTTIAREFNLAGIAGGDTQTVYTVPNGQTISGYTVVARADGGQELMAILSGGQVVRIRQVISNNAWTWINANATVLFQPMYGTNRAVVVWGEVQIANNANNALLMYKVIPPTGITTSCGSENLIYSDAGGLSGCFTVGTNLASGKPVYQSSNYSNNDLASKATDGVVSQNNYTHTKSNSGGDSEPWLRVDLLTAHMVNKVRVWPRRDCCDTRWKNQQWDVELLGKTGEILQSKRIPAIVDIRSAFDIDFDTKFQTNKKVYSVRVQYKRDGLIDNDGYLSISELQVFGNADIPTIADNTLFGYDTNRTYGKNLALFKPASQSEIITATPDNNSNGNSRNIDSASYAVDGKQLFAPLVWDQLNNSKVTLVDKAGIQNPWWEVDLQGRNLVNKVRVYTLNGGNRRFNNIAIKLIGQSNEVLAVQYEKRNFDSEKTDLKLDYYFSGASGVRKVRIEQLTSGEWLNFGEVEVYGVEENTAEPNLARIKDVVATQHSNWNDAFKAEKAIDGNKSGAANNLSATQYVYSAPYAWWEVDFNKPRIINLVRVWRRDADRIESQNNRDLKVQLFKGKTDTIPDYETVVISPNYQRQFDIWIPNRPDITRVRIVKTEGTENEALLSLAEVEVFGSSYPSNTAYIGKSNNTYATPAVFNGGPESGFTQTLAEAPLFLQNHIGQVESFTLNNARTTIAREFNFAGTAGGDTQTVYTVPNGQTISGYSVMARADGGQELLAILSGGQVVRISQVISNNAWTWSSSTSTVLFDPFLISDGTVSTWSRIDISYASEVYTYKAIPPTLPTGKNPYCAGQDTLYSDIKGNFGCVLETSNIAINPATRIYFGFPASAASAANFSSVASSLRSQARLLKDGNTQLSTSLASGNLYVNSVKLNLPGSYRLNQIKVHFNGSTGLENFILKLSDAHGAVHTSVKVASGLTGNLFNLPFDTTSSAASALLVRSIELEKLVSSNSPFNIAEIQVYGDRVINPVSVASHPSMPGFSLSTTRSTVASSITAQSTRANFGFIFPAMAFISSVFYHKNAEAQTAVLSTENTDTYGINLVKGLPAQQFRGYFFDGRWNHQINPTIQFLTDGVTQSQTKFVVDKQYRDSAENYVRLDLPSSIIHTVRIFCPTDCGDINAFQILFNLDGNPSVELSSENYFKKSDGTIDRRIIVVPLAFGAPINSLEIRSKHLTLECGYWSNFWGNDEYCNKKLEISEIEAFGTPASVIEPVYTEFYDQEGTSVSLDHNDLRRRLEAVSTCNGPTLISRLLPGRPACFDGAKLREQKQVGSPAATRVVHRLGSLKNLHLIKLNLPTEHESFLDSRNILIKAFDENSNEIFSSVDFKPYPNIFTALVWIRTSKPADRIVIETQNGVELISTTLYGTSASGRPVSIAKNSQNGFDGSQILPGNEFLLHSPLTASSGDAYLKSHTDRRIQFKFENTAEGGSVIKAKTHEYGLDDPHKIFQSSQRITKAWIFTTNPGRYQLWYMLQGSGHIYKQHFDNGIDYLPSVPTHGLNNLVFNAGAVLTNGVFNGQTFPWNDLLFKTDPAAGLVIKAKVQNPPQGAFCSGNSIYLIAESALSGCSFEPNNIAFRKPAYQSSTNADKIPGYAIDGNPDLSSSYSSTASGPAHWWRVDMARQDEQFSVSGVTISLKAPLEPKYFAEFLDPTGTVLQAWPIGGNSISTVYKLSGFDQRTPVHSFRIRTAAIDGEALISHQLQIQEVKVFGASGGRFDQGRRVNTFGLELAGKKLNPKVTISSGAEKVIDSDLFNSFPLLSGRNIVIDLSKVSMIGSIGLLTDRCQTISDLRNIRFEFLGPRGEVLFSKRSKTYDATIVDSTCFNHFDFDLDGIRSIRVINEDSSRSINIKELKVYGTPDVNIGLFSSSNLDVFKSLTDGFADVNVGSAVGLTQANPKIELSIQPTRVDLVRLKLPLEFSLDENISKQLKVSLFYRDKSLYTNVINLSPASRVVNFWVPDNLTGSGSDNKPITRVVLEPATGSTSLDNFKFVEAEVYGELLKDHLSNAEFVPSGDARKIYQFSNPQDHSKLSPVFVKDRNFTIATSFKLDPTSSTSPRSIFSLGHKLECSVINNTSINCLDTLIEVEPLNSDVEHMLHLVVFGSRAQLFLDGNSISDYLSWSPDSWNGNLDNIILGNKLDLSSPLFGQILEFIIVGRVMTPDQILNDPFDRLVGDKLSKDMVENDKEPWVYSFPTQNLHSSFTLFVAGDFLNAASSADAFKPIFNFYDRATNDWSARCDLMQAGHVSCGVKIGSEYKSGTTPIGTNLSMKNVRIGFSYNKNAGVGTFKVNETEIPISGIDLWVSNPILSIGGAGLAANFDHIQLFGRDMTTSEMDAIRPNDQFIPYVNLHRYSDVYSHVGEVRYAVSGNSKLRFKLRSPVLTTAFIMNGKCTNGITNGGTARVLFRYVETNLDMPINDYISCTSNPIPRQHLVDEVIIMPLATDKTVLLTDLALFGNSVSETGILARNSNNSTPGVSLLTDEFVTLSTELHAGSLYQSISRPVDDKTVIPLSLGSVKIGQNINQIYYSVTGFKFATADKLDELTSSVYLNLKIADQTVDKPAIIRSFSLNEINQKAGVILLNTYIPVVRSAELVINWKPGIQKPVRISEIELYGLPVHDLLSTMKFPGPFSSRYVTSSSVLSSDYAAINAIQISPVASKPFVTKVGYNQSWSIKLPFVANISAIRIKDSGYDGYHFKRDGVNINGMRMDSSGSVVSSSQSQVFIDKGLFESETKLDYFVVPFSATGINMINIYLNDYAALSLSDVEIYGVPSTQGESYGMFRPSDKSAANTVNTMWSNLSSRYHSGYIPQTELVSFASCVNLKLDGSRDFWTDQAALMRCGLGVLLGSSYIIPNLGTKPSNTPKTEVDINTPISTTTVTTEKELDCTKYHRSPDDFSHNFDVYDDETDNQIQEGFYVMFQDEDVLSDDPGFNIEKFLMLGNNRIHWSKFCNLANTSITENYCTSSEFNMKRISLKFIEKGIYAVPRYSFPTEGNTVVYMSFIDGEGLNLKTLSEKLKTVKEQDAIPHYQYPFVDDKTTEQDLSKGYIARHACQIKVLNVSPASKIDD